MAIAVIEGGGTNFNCGLFAEDSVLVVSHRVPTTRPEETVRECARFLVDAAGSAGISAAGLACFGPMNLDPGSPDYGEIEGTPKEHWEGFNVRRAFSQSLRVPTYIETDVGGAALGEYRWGAARGQKNFAYVTVGTGIGAAVFAGGRLRRGASHYELGHVSVKRASGDDYPGNCPFHGDCLSGLACGPAIADRWGRAAQDLPEDHPAWALQAHYLSEFCVSLVYSHAPSLILIGGGVMAAPGLLHRVQAAMLAKLGGYHCGFLTGAGGPPADPAEMPGPALRAPELGSRSALYGALSLVEDARVPGVGRSA